MPAATAIVKLEELGDTTKLTDTSVYETATDLEKVLAMGMEQGMKESLDRLEEQAKRHAGMHYGGQTDHSTH